MRGLLLMYLLESWEAWICWKLWFVTTDDGFDGKLCLPGLCVLA
jgi:hypothetical protein